MDEVIRGKDQEPGPTSHVIVGRFNYVSSPYNNLNTVEEYALSPGDALIFASDITDPTAFGETIATTQDEFEKRVLRLLAEGGNMALLAMVDKGSGSLLATTGHKTESWGINKQVPFNQRVFSLHSKNTQIFFIWGSNKMEAETHLEQLQFMRRMRN